MQYPFAISFQEDDTARRYVVRANDSDQAVRRARREYERDPNRPPGVRGDVGRVMNLTPKQDEGKFLPRIDGTILPAAPCDDADQAVESALMYVKRESTR